jgi:hypothetical protein
LNRRFLVLLCALVGTGLWADDAANLVVVKITPQVQEADHSVAWEQPLTQSVAPGSPVVVNINAENLSIRVTVTPFVRGKDYLLVVQGDVRQTKDTAVTRTTNLQSLLTPPDETIAYFPLGRNPTPGRQMVVLIRVGLHDE